MCTSAPNDASNTRQETNIPRIPPSARLPCRLCNTRRMSNTRCKSLNIKFLVLSALAFLPASSPAAKHPSMPEVLAAASPTDWRPLDPENTLYVELPGGRVVIELAPAFAPLHVVNIKTLTRAGYFNGLSIIREQDNYVAQWGDPENRHPLPPGIDKVA